MRMSFKTRFTVLMLPVLVFGVACSRQATIVSSSTSTLKRTAVESDPHLKSPCDDAVVRQIPLTGPLPLGRRVPSRPGKLGNPGMPAMVEIASPNRSPRARGLQDVDTIVLHHTASPAPAERIAQFFQRRDAEVSSHYVVGKNGALIRCVADAEQAWHAGPSTFKGRNLVNRFSIGIEICNVGDGKDPYPQAQYEILAKLMAHLMTERRIGWDFVTRHRDVATPAGSKIDTSNNFDLALLKRAVSEAGGPGAAVGLRIGVGT
jgi:hypothetical protein